MVGVVLKKLRTEANLSQWELGHELGVSQQAIGQWEKGAREPDSKMIKAIANYFKVTIDYLMGNSSAEDTNLREVMIVKKETTLSFLEKLRNDTINKKVVWHRFPEEAETETEINSTLSFYAYVANGCVFLNYKEPESVTLTIQFDREEHNAIIDIPYDPEIQKLINNLYNTVYEVLPSLEKFIDDYLSAK